MSKTERVVVVTGANTGIGAAFAKAVGAPRVTWSRRYGQAERDIDAAIKANLVAQGIAAESFCDRLLADPWTLTTQSGTPFRVYSPFYRALSALGDPAPPLPAPRKIKGVDPALLPRAHRVQLDDLALRPRIAWDTGMAETWPPGEAGAAARLDDFMANGLKGYAEGRDRPDLAHVSRLSPHLRFGEISPRQVWHAARFAAAEQPRLAADIDKFLSELGWREFCRHLLYDVPDLAERNLQSSFDAFPWKRDAKALRAWQRGQTGYPIVDAGMRELWHTGMMHNRVRMVVASFLVKHLLIDWREGERWFWDTLVDADAGSNPGNWQWVAGSGADAAPYFRVFNPILQGEKFDPDGAYVRRWVPELARLPHKFIHQPWEATPLELAAAGIEPGKTYPPPIVDHKAGRERALQAYATIRNN